MIITFGKPQTYNKRKVIEIQIDVLKNNYDMAFTIEKYDADKTWYFYHTTDKYDTNKKKTPKLWHDDLRILKKAITEQLEQYLIKAGLI